MTHPPPLCPPSPRAHFKRFAAIVAAAALSLLATAWFLLESRVQSQPHAVPANYRETLRVCSSLHDVPTVPVAFDRRSVSDRFVPGTPAVWLRNGTIWTGDHNGTEILRGDVLLARGLVRLVGTLSAEAISSVGVNFEDLEIVDVKGRWITPGIIDAHSHLGVYPSPELGGTLDGNSVLGITQPWLRSLDGLNTHDDAFELSISGGITTALIIPGSAGAIGGQGFVIKLRKTTERSAFSRLLEPPFTFNGSGIEPVRPMRWRQLKQACGENPHGVYDATRMDSIWSFRTIYNEARQVLEQQNQYCRRAEAGEWRGLGEFPTDLRLEALVDVLRGRVRVQNHCYTTVDFDGLVRLTNEFKFHIAAFHHAHEAYLVPDLLKKMYGGPPALALFATNARYKIEAYRGSEFAPRILAESSLKVAMKSDHPVLDSRFLLYEAQQAHYYGLPEHLALASVTSTPAEILGMVHRIGSIKQGYDADVVVWDSHPLALGATPAQVYIDGIAQLDDPRVVSKPAAFQVAPSVPNFDEEAIAAVKWEGLPPLKPKPHPGTVVFKNLTEIWSRTKHGPFFIQAMPPSTVVVIERGKIICSDAAETCLAPTLRQESLVVDLQGGVLAPGLISFGAPLGLEEIEAESSTGDGMAPDALSEIVSPIAGGEGILIRASDGLQFGGRSALLAYMAGVTSAVVAPRSRGFIAGLGTAVSLSAMHRLERGAVIQEVTALHLNVAHGSKHSVSTIIAVLRRGLLGDLTGESGKYFALAAKGIIPLVIQVASADIIATILDLKKAVDGQTGKRLRLTFVRATEAHLLAKQIAAAGAGVILIPSKPFPLYWDDRRILPGPPLSNQTAISVLLAHNVTVGIGILESWSARNTRFDLAWAALEADGAISKETALALASTNLEKLLGVHYDDEEFVAYRGGDIFSFESRAVAVMSARRGQTELFV